VEEIVSEEGCRRNQTPTKAEPSQHQTPTKADSSQHQTPTKADPSQHHQTPTKADPSLRTIFEPNQNEQVRRTNAFFPTNQKCLWRKMTFVGGRKLFPIVSPLRDIKLHMKEQIV
jgi:hypothetical protein